MGFGVGFVVPAGRVLCIASMAAMLVPTSV